MHLHANAQDNKAKAEGAGMAISEKATEFAGLPVIDYQPAVGLVLPTMPRRVFRSADGTSVWAITLERELVTIDSGSTQAESKTSPTPELARDRYRQLVAEKTKEGYAEQKVPDTTVREALASALLANPDDAASRMAFADYLSEHGEQLPAAAYRVDREDYDEDIVPHLESLLADPAVGLLQALVIGCWGEESDTSSDAVVAALMAARDRLPSLRALFLGDIPFTDNEMSWIVQTDLTDLLTAFPKLEHFRARGGDGLVLREFGHDKLKSLAIEASNLSRQVVRVVGTCRLPALERLEIWLGTDRYGADTEVGDLTGILQGKHLPALNYLGLRNSEIADDIARALASAPVLGRLRVLDLSLGTLSDAGAEALLATPGLARLEKLDVHHHYLSPAMIERLRGLGIEVDASDPQESDDYRYVAHAE
jgi:uncharacterized protein (TIGR02996 family)